ncbi:MAG: hypothetical protein FWC47_06995 [Oscillospiraceae bacterium]|nr:hypothetical protein [Oscillospiraceae bacterium]
METNLKYELTGLILKTGVCLSILIIACIFSLWRAIKRLVLNNELNQTQK